MEDSQDGSQPRWKMAEMEDGRDRKQPRWKMAEIDLVDLKTPTNLECDFE